MEYQRESRRKNKQIIKRENMMMVMMVMLKRLRNRPAPLLYPRCSLCKSTCTSKLRERNHPNLTQATHGTSTRTRIPTVTVAPQPQPKPKQKQAQPELRRRIPAPKIKSRRETVRSRPRRRRRRPVKRLAPIAPKRSLISPRRSTGESLVICWARTRFEAFAGRRKTPIMTCVRTPTTASLRNKNYNLYQYLNPSCRPHRKQARPRKQRTNRPHLHSWV
mmetsp:Transcript_13940/g.25170  ORF Transcript_13940/g.25170 Transcript_13940/m.25170 type:complete len:219 (+) Transcript_13940:649-1305(+)